SARASAVVSDRTPDHATPGHAPVRSAADRRKARIRDIVLRPGDSPSRRLISAKIMASLYGFNLANGKAVSVARAPRHGRERHGLRGFRSGPGATGCSIPMQSPVHTRPCDHSSAIRCCDTRLMLRRDRITPAARGAASTEPQGRPLARMDNLLALPVGTMLASE